MTYREKVIKGIECCSRESEYLNDNPCKDCPFQDVDSGYGGQCIDRLQNSALELLKEPEQKWINVEDKLPEIRRVVLAYSPFHKNIWAVSMYEDGEWYYWLPVSKKYDPDWQGPITHWTTLPEIPDD